VYPQPAAPRPGCVTPCVKTLAHAYFDPGARLWRRHPTLQRDNGGRWRMPNRLRLSFVHGKMQAETTITLPAALGPLPHF